MRLFNGKLEIRSPFKLTAPAKVSLVVAHPDGETSVVTVESESAELIISALGNVTRPARLRALARQIGGMDAFMSEPTPNSFPVGEPPEIHWGDEFDGRD